MNLRSIADTLMRGQVHYAIGRFATVRRTAAQLISLRQRGALSPLGASLADRSIFDGVDARRKAADMRREGIAHGFTLPPPIAAELAEFGRTAMLENRSRGVRFRYADVASGRVQGGPIAMGFVESPMDHPAARRVRNDPTLHAVAKAHLGYQPRGVQVKMWWNFAGDITLDERRDQGQTIDFHFDVHALNFVYAHFYLTDTTRTSGAHVYVRRSTDRKPMRFLLHSARQTEEAVAAEYGADAIEVIEGPAGSGFVEDTSAYHKALPPETADRLLLQLRYF